MPTCAYPGPCRCPRCARRAMHPPGCQCAPCWRRRRRCLRAQVLGPGSAVHSAVSESRNGDFGNDGGMDVVRPEDRHVFDLPSTRSGILWALGGVGSLIVAQRFSREMSQGKKFEEVVDGVITAMALYWALEHMRNIHNSSIPNDKPS